MSIDTYIHNPENPSKPEVEFINQSNKTKPNRRPGPPRLIPPVQVNDLEDICGYNKLLDRLFAELPPANIQQEGDLVTLTQLRWTAERLNSLIEREINHRVRMPHLQSNGDPGERLMMAYRLCLAEKVFLLLTKQQLDTVKAINPLAARVEKWVANQAPKPPKPPKPPSKSKLTRLKDEEQGEEQDQ